MEVWLIVLITFIVVICTIIFSLAFIKFYIVVTTGWNRSLASLAGKTAIVTGSNIGIGYYTALNFATRGARVILACRNKTKAEAARTSIIEKTGNENVIVKIVDLSSLSSVRQFAKDINETEDRLDILINNAGLGLLPHSYTEDGLSMSMQVNHFGPFLLTVLLIGLMKRSAPSRVVTVSSKAADMGKINVDTLNEPVRRLSKVYDYANVKLCNLLFTIKLAQILEGTGVSANAVHPGAVATDFLKDNKDVTSRILGILMKFTYKSTEAGAQTTLYAATSKELNGINGKYFAECAEIPFPRSVENGRLANALWDKSIELVKLTSDESISMFSN